MSRLAFILATSLAAVPAVAQTPLFHGTASDCESDRFGGHLPAGFVCRGYGTGQGACAKAGDNRVIYYQIGPMPQWGCRIDWTPASAAELQRLRRFIACNGSLPDCAMKANPPVIPPPS